MQNADYIIIGSGSVEMLLPFFSFPTLPFENDDAADSKGNRAKGQIDTKHLMHNNCAEQARCNGKVAHPTDVHPVAWRTHLAAIPADAQVGGYLLSTARRIGFGKLHDFEAINELAGEALFGHAPLSNFKSPQATLGLTS